MSFSGPLVPGFEPPLEGTMGHPLWAPWRMEYILGPKTKGACVFCVAASAQESELKDRLVVCNAENGVVMLNRYPFAPGHLLIIPRQHVSDLSDLSEDDNDGLFRLVRTSAERLRRAVKPEGVNVGINLGKAAGAGISEHLHVHIVPRWPGDSNFMPVIADKRVIPQALDETREHLAGFFGDLAVSAGQS